MWVGVGGNLPSSTERVHLRSGQMWWEVEKTITVGHTAIRVKSLEPLLATEQVVMDKSPTVLEASGLTVCRSQCCHLAILEETVIGGIGLSPTQQGFCLHWLEHSPVYLFICLAQKALLWRTVGQTVQHSSRGAGVGFVENRTLDGGGSERTRRNILWR